MRYPQPFQVALFCKGDCLSEILFQQLTVFTSQQLEGDRYAILSLPVDDHLILGKHRLPKERSYDVIKLFADDICLHPVVAGMVNQVLCEELFIECRCHFRFEDGIVIVEVGVVLGAVIAVH